MREREERGGRKTDEVERGEKGKEESGKNRRKKNVKWGRGRQ